MNSSTDSSGWPVTSSTVFGHAVVPILAMEPGHGRDVLIDVRSELGVREHLRGPRLPGDVDVGNRSAQRVGVLLGDAIHVLRSWTRQLEDAADIRARVGEDRGDDPCDVVGRDRRRATGPEREPDGAAVGDGAAQPGS